jgi:hypothetical protein
VYFNAGTLVLAYFEKRYSQTNIMNPHLNIFNNYREDYNNPLENNLTRAFIITFKNEPNLLRDFMFLISGAMA